MSDVNAQVRVVLEDYLFAADLEDYDLMADCFTDDADVSYDLKPHKFVGGRALAEWVAAAHARSRSVRTHVMANCHIAREGAMVRAVSNVLATLAIPTESGYDIKVRGLRYDDELVETERGWKISRRTHIPLWQYEATGDALMDIARKK